jgi:hypothetical protein
MLIAALFTVALCYEISQGAYQQMNVMKKNEIISFAEKWMELEVIMSSELSQTKTNTKCFSYVEARAKEKN